MVERYAGHYKGRTPYYFCRCDCGTLRTVKATSLTTKASVSCGCAKPGSIKHGQVKSRTYKSWATMLSRCNNPKATRYDLYGGRGITVCNRWKDFRNFLEDMGERPEKTSIDRIDRNGNYEPANCRWATQKEQMNNMSRNILHTVGGNTLTTAQWLEHFGIKQSTFDQRVYVYGWDRLVALTTPTGKRG